MVFDLYECMWCSVLVHEDSLIISYLPRRTIDFDFMLLLFLIKSPSLDEILICTNQRTKNKEFSRILLPIDGSESSMKAADYAIAIARKKQRIIMLN